MPKKDYSKKYEEAKKRAESSDLDNIKLEQGLNVIRVVSLDFEETYLHYVKDTNGDTKRVVCPAGIENRKDASEVCPICAEYKETKDSDIRAQHRYFFNAVQGTVEKVKKNGRTVNRFTLNNDVKLWDMGVMIFNQVSAIQLDDELEDIDGINLKITRTGKDLNTEYQVLPSAKPTSLPEDLTDLIDLEELVEPASITEINNILGIEEEEKPDKKASNKKKKTGKKVEEEEGDDGELDDGELDELDEIDEEDD